MQGVSENFRIWALNDGMISRWGREGYVRFGYGFTLPNFRMAWLNHFRARCPWGLVAVPAKSHT